MYAFLESREWEGKSGALAERVLASRTGSFFLILFLISLVRFELKSGRARCPRDVTGSSALNASHRWEGARQDSRQLVERALVSRSPIALVVSVVASRRRQSWTGSRSRKKPVPRRNWSPPPAPASVTFAYFTLIRFNLASRFLFDCCFQKTFIESLDRFIDFGRTIGAVARLRGV